MLAGSSKPLIFVVNFLNLRLLHFILHFFRNVEIACLKGQTPVANANEPTRDLLKYQQKWHARLCPLKCPKFQRDKIEQKPAQPVAIVRKMQYLCMGVSHIELVATPVPSWYLRKRVSVPFVVVKLKRLQNFLKFDYFNQFVSFITKRRNGGKLNFYRFVFHFFCI